MARHFAETEIDRFREAFYLNANRKTGVLERAPQLCFVMRSLGYCPTIEESERYFKEAGNKVDFAKFLDMLHGHAQREQAYGEIMAAFRSHDRSKSGYISAKELRSILLGMGEKMKPREVDAIFKEASINPNGNVKYEAFAKLISTPLPDY